MNYPILRLRTADQKVLFVDEISGQISDGQWENSKPRNHWKPWCSCDVIVDPVVQGRNFYAPRTVYGLTSPTLLSIIGNRMERLVKLARKYGPDQARNLSDHLFDLDGKFSGMPKYPGEYWDDIRATLSLYDMGEVNAIANSDSYTRKDLLKDLREIKAAMETFV